jgi:hypothetical protein
MRRDRFEFPPVSATTSCRAEVSGDADDGSTSTADAPLLGTGPAVNLV